ncbi:PH (Pleckstrin Homology) domain-containing protein [Tumebacillus sp. BK434]|uniref:PH domain-containing protein n=1 Tax=Tumebacillus sp. BK434 TaxID=2512169 RepID=UPI0010508271|nr:PH domain-containing protein [Tumebacillus sp. BK434]TCP58112.1 PH (Pleckstrin Homology) domain-containing protein [Tumebacillus sp. BK434]
MRYPSKKGPFIYLFFGGTLLFLLVVAGIAILDREWPAIVIVVATMALILWLFNTYYEFRENELYIKGGPFRWRIPYQQIRSVRKTRSIISGPALSLDRMEIRSTYDSVLISPEREAEFLAELKKRSPQLRTE